MTKCKAQYQTELFPCELCLCVHAGAPAAVGGAPAAALHGGDADRQHHPGPADQQVQAPGEQAVQGWLWQGSEVKAEARQAWSLVEPGWHGRVFNHQTRAVLPCCRRSRCVETKQTPFTVLAAKLQAALVWHMGVLTTFPLLPKLGGDRGRGVDGGVRGGAGSVHPSLPARQRRPDLQQAAARRPHDAADRGPRGARRKTWMMIPRAVPLD